MISIYILYCLSVFRFVYRKRQNGLVAIYFVREIRNKITMGIGKFSVQIPTMQFDFSNSHAVNLNRVLPFLTFYLIPSL